MVLVIPQLRPYIDSGDFPNPVQGCRTSASFAPHPVESGLPLDISLRRHPLSIDNPYGVHSPDTVLKGFGDCRVSRLRSLILSKAYQLLVNPDRLTIPDIFKRLPSSLEEKKHHQACSTALKSRRRTNGQALGRFALTLLDRTVPLIDSTLAERP